MQSEYSGKLSISISKTNSSMPTYSFSSFDITFEGSLRLNQFLRQLMS